MFIIIIEGGIVAVYSVVVFGFIVVEGFVLGVVGLGSGLAVERGWEDFFGEGDSVFGAF